MVRRWERIRQENVGVAAGARSHHFDDLAPVPFLCECDDEACHEFVTMTLPDFQRLRVAGRHVLAPGHAIRDEPEAAPGDAEGGREAASG